MALFTKKGDDGATGIFGCNQRISKSSKIAEALGAMDEVNSLLGVVKIKCESESDKNIVEGIQMNLFIIQAEIAGADKHIEKTKTEKLEEIIDEIEKKLPPIKNFFVSGESELSAMFDFARTVARRAERRVVEVSEEGIVKIDAETLKYLNRLSSVLYALARFSNHVKGFSEKIPDYK